MSNKINVLAISGSARSASFNTALLFAASELTETGIDIEIYDGVSQLPIFSQELEGVNRPREVIELDEAIRRADAVLISTPEYNGSLPGGLKNFLDWGSRPYADGAFVGKPTAVIGASTGQYGGARAVQATAEILRHMGSNVLSGHLTVGTAQSKFNSAGVLRDEMTKKSLVEIVNRLRELSEVGVDTGIKVRS